ncbi:MAG TPA: cupin domain-containing protein [Thermomicrobiales bacterium]|nr:cupin domain-containing protein [Thermomicrobiales bacterium]
MLRDVLVGADEGEALWFFGMLVLVKASSGDTDDQFSLTEQRARRGTATPFHRQIADQETFHVLDGKLRFYLDEGEPIVAGAGPAPYIPAGAAQAFEVGSETGRLANPTAPNHEAFFRAAADPAQARTYPPEQAPDMPRVMAAAERYGVEILGPPPGGGHD